VFLMVTLISDHCISPKPFKLTYYCAEENRCFGVKVLSPPILPVVTDLLIFYCGEVDGLAPGVLDYLYAPAFTKTTFRRDSSIDSPT
jgi:hypothetical protein